MIFYLADATLVGVPAIIRLKIERNGFMTSERFKCREKPVPRCGAGFFFDHLLRCLPR